MNAKTHPKTRPQTLKTPAKPAAPRPVQRLKAERVELMLARLPDWSTTESRASLLRIFDLGSPHQATVFAGFLSGLLAKRRGHVGISQRKVSVLLDGEPGKRIAGPEATLARRIERLMEVMKRGWEGR